MKNEYMNLSFYQMWYFICAMELGSYSKASQKLNVTQSAISKTIQNIEQNLQVQLFAREKIYWFRRTPEKACIVPGKM